jgi:hypothetical protein
MSTPFYHFGKRDYIDFLQDESFVDSIRREIRSSTRSLIAATGQRQRDQMSATQRASVDLSNQVRSLSGELGQGLTELNSNFHWGFSEILMSLGGVAVSLNELIRIAQNPSKIWAYEQFDDARAAHRKQLFPEAAEYVNRAINGHANHMGYNLEYRFHYFLGVLRVGSFGNNTREIVNLAQAKAAFLNAARCAVHDEPKEAAKAYLGAGWASYCQGQMGESRTYSEQACLLDPSLSEAFFQLAKVLMYLNDTNAGVKHLRTAILQDPGYTRKAKDDEDFQHEAVEKLLTAFSQEAKRPYEQAVIACEEKLYVLKQLTAENPSLGNFSEMGNILGLLSDAHALSVTDTYEGYLEATVHAALARSQIDRETARINNETAHIRAELESRARRERKSKDDAKRKELAGRVKKAATFGQIAMCFSLGGLSCLVPSVVGLILGIISINGLRRFEDSEVREQAILRTAKTHSIIAIIVGGIITFLLGLAVLEDVSRR